MKKSLIVTLIAAPLMSLSSLASAAEPVASEPMQLSASEMDGITAGRYFNNAGVVQINVNPVTVVQVALAFNGGTASNVAGIDISNIINVRR